MTFDATRRAAQQLQQFSISVAADAEGYLDRECPSDDCRFQFKVLLEDWKHKVKNEEVFCPNCGHTTASSSWSTKEQLDYVRQAAFAKIKATFGDALRQDAAAWNRPQPRDSFIKITMRVDSRPQQVSLPPAAAEPMQLKITCGACACRYAVVGAAYFCPACVHNPAEVGHPF